MGHKFPSEAWTAAYKDAVNNNEKYKTAGKDWTHGAVAFVIKADAAAGLKTDAGMILDVHGGECRGTKYVTSRADADEAPFVIVGEYDRWKEVIEGAHDPIKAMLEGKLDLVKGHLPTMIRYVESSRQLVVSATAVDTDFPR